MGEVHETVFDDINPSGIEDWISNYIAEVNRELLEEASKHEEKYDAALTAAVELIGSCIWNSLEKEWSIEYRMKIKNYDSPSDLRPVINENEFREYESSNDRVTMRRRFKQKMSEISSDCDREIIQRISGIRDDYGIKPAVENAGSPPNGFDTDTMTYQAAVYYAADCYLRALKQIYRTGVSEDRLPDSIY